MGGSFHKHVSVTVVWWFGGLLRHLGQWAGLPMPSPSPALPPPPIALPFVLLISWSSFACLVSAAC
jgi:hypothetical protein